jgi:tripartite-type tricarboxylate transporter receptor subunit TctC
MTNYYGLLVPAKTPKDVVAKLHDAVVKTVATPSVQESLRSGGADPRTMTPDEFTRFIREDIKKWAALVKSSGIKVER